MYTKNQYISDLWDKNPEMMKRMLKRILSLKKQDSIFLYGKNEDGFTFKYCYYEGEPGRYKSILVDDFQILYEGQCYNEITSMKWMTFMLKLYGKEYIDNYQTTRNGEIVQYVDRFNDKTNRIVEQLNKLYDKNCQGEKKKADELNNNL
jgi:hypothetical protein